MGGSGFASCACHADNLAWKQIIEQQDFVGYQLTEFLSQLNQWLCGMNTWVHHYYFCPIDVGFRMTTKAQLYAAFDFFERAREFFFSFGIRDSYLSSLLDEPVGCS